MSNFMYIVAIILPLIVSASGCVRYMPAAVSSTSIGSRYERPVRAVTGQSSAFYILGIGPTGDDSLNAAIEDAKSYDKADSIANVFVDRRVYGFPCLYLPIIARIDTMIFGTLVKYSDESGKDIGETEIRTFENQGLSKKPANSSSSPIIPSESPSTVEVFARSLDFRTVVTVILKDGRKVTGELEESTIYGISLRKVGGKRFFGFKYFRYKDIEKIKKGR